jgi:hypothetical protein
MRYPITAKVTKERIAEFREKVTNRLPKMKALGQFVGWYLTGHPEELTYDWLNLSRKILEEAYRYAGITPGFDINMQYVEVDEYDPRLDIIAILWRKILEANNKKVGYTVDDGKYILTTSSMAIFETVLETHSVDFMIKKEDEVIFTSRVLQLIRDEGINIDSMNALAELFADYHFEYAQRRVLVRRRKC